LQLQTEPLPSTPVNHDFAPVAYYFDVALWSAPFHPASARWIESLAGVSFRRVLLGTLLALMALAPMLWIWPTRGREKSMARTRRSAAFAVAVVGFTELALEILLLLGFQALYGYVYHELTILVALFMVGVALGAGWALRSSPAAGDAPLRRDLWLLAGVQIVVGASPLLFYGLFVHLGRLSSSLGQWAASEILFPALALFAGIFGGIHFLLSSRIYFADKKSARISSPGASQPQTSQRADALYAQTRATTLREPASSPGVVYALDLAGSCAGALALSVLLIPIYGFLRTALLMAAVNLVPTAMVAVCAQLAPQARS